MHRLASATLATLLAATVLPLLRAQTPFTDPANLRGERVTPLNGHELPVDKSEADGGHGLQQLLRKLNTRASLMLIVAHPDDEDGGMLTLYSRGLGARVADLSLNRGEGGQNAMTGDFEDALGLIRTQELLSADRYFDATQFFGTEVDFGFSKTKEESFAKWGHQRVLYDVVRAIRLYRPLVITSVWIGGVTDGHGQHQAAGEIAQEAFIAAADPNVFPELTAEGILPWAPLKVYARVPRQAVTAQGLFDYATNQYTPARFTNYVTGAVTTTLPSADVIIHEGTTDPLLTPAGANRADLAVNPGERDLLANPTTPLSYVQFARVGLGLQRSQIDPGMRLPPPGAFDIAYHLYGSRLCNASADAQLPSAPPTNCHLDRSLAASPQGAVERPAAPPAAAFPPDASNPNPQPASFFDGIDTTVAGIATLAPGAPASFRNSLAELQATVATATAHFNPSTPATIAPTLADALKQCDALIKTTEASSLNPEAKTNVLHDLRIKRAQLNQALTLALGLSLNATTSRADLVQGESAPIALDLSETSADPVAVTFNGVNGDGDYQPPETAPQLSPGHLFARAWPINAVLGMPFTRPYFHRLSIEQPVYELWDQRLRNAAQTPAPYTAIATVRYRDVTLRLERTVHSGLQPVSVIPPVSISFDSHANVVPLSTNVFKTTVHVENVRNTPLDGVLTLGPPTGWSLTPHQVALTGLPPFKSLSVPIELDAHPVTTMANPLGSGIDATLAIRGDTRQTYGEGFRSVGYPGLISTNYFTYARDRIVPVDLKLPEHRRIAYLRGTGDDVPEALGSIGLTPTILTVADLTPANLAKYDMVILGVRTYNAHPDLHGAPTQALLDYAKNGGNVLVQYQTPEFTAADAPYPLTLGNAEKVVDETDPVRLLDPSSQLLTTPNRITPADFDHWIEERGHGFLHTWDPRYTALTETQDPGQEPQLGGLITTKLGKGRWTYCAFAIYRQLPEAVPGAFRLFVNLLNP
jgi:LmbE family N-acetylglucosaminyl deacetylase